MPYVVPCRYGYMIDNVVLIITGTHHDREAPELLEKCHPLGMFEAMGTLVTASSPSDLYRYVLVDTPLGARRGAAPRRSPCAAARVRGLTHRGCGRTQARTLATASRSRISTR